MLEYRKFMDWRTETHPNLNVVAAFAIWSVSFVFSFCALGFAALCAGLLKLELFNSDTFPNLGDAHYNRHQLCSSDCCRAADTRTINYQPACESCEGPYGFG
jgi:hypothetical protein